MMTLGQAVVVEGRYDKIKLDAVVDAIVVTTDGFNIFRDKDKQQLLKRLAKECGIIVLTDSDDAGFKIRKFIGDLVTDGELYHAYIPDVAGKERRKTSAGAAGLIGVEGLAADIVENALYRCMSQYGLDGYQATAGDAVTVADLYEDGFSGRPGAAKRRAALLELAGLPRRLSTNALLQLLTRLYGYAGYKSLTRQL